jgi:ubiquinone/menaquinone biosynthesis C-methylase UbiE
MSAVPRGPECHVRALRISCVCRSTGACVHPVACSGDALPFKASAFDLVFWRSTLQYLDYRAGMREMTRTAKEDRFVYIFAGMT